MLDLGCGDGSLLRFLKEVRGAFGYGIEIDDANILASVRNRVNVLQSDLESGLAGFESGSFDYVILSQTLQAVRHTEQIIGEMLRVGRAGYRDLPQLRLLGPSTAGAAGPHAGVPYPAVSVVQHAQRAPVHHWRLRDLLRDQGIRILERVVHGPWACRFGCCPICWARWRSIASTGVRSHSQSARGGAAQLACSTAESAARRRAVLA